ncbi:MAG: MtaA/CmuA family methyltransferase [Bacillota bacterium]|jgi:MtaA/CmuA family methyltransferase
MEMTQKERLAAAAKGKTVDRPPCICPGGMMNMMFSDIMDISGVCWPEAHTDPKKMAALAIAINSQGCFENYGVPFCMTVEAESMGAIVNMGDKLCEPHVVSSPLSSCAEFSKLQTIDLSSGRAKTVIDAISILHEIGGDVPIVGNLTGPISLAGTLLDMSTLLREMRKSPDDADAFLSFVADNLIIFAKAQIAAGADVICISEPSGTGEILGPKFFEKYTVTYLNKVLDAIDVGVKIVHICGQMKSVYQIISKIHCDVFSFDAIVNIESVKEALTTQKTMGNISIFALSSQAKDKISSLVSRAVKKGVDIVSPACGLSTLTPIENVKTILETVKNL